MLRKNYVGVVSILFIILDDLGLKTSEDDVSLFLGILSMVVFISGPP
jgi:hypothetical protein